MIATYIKQLLTVLAAALGGFVLGVYSTAARVQRSQPLGAEPAWVGSVEQVYLIATAGAVVCALAWIYVDYRYSNHD